MSSCDELRAGNEALREADERARTRALEEFERPLLVEAGAGTGKTALLVARVLAWALGPGWGRAAGELGREAAEDGSIARRVLEGVVAITFTDDAAAEMQGRVLAALVALAEHGRAALEQSDLRALARAALPDDAALRARAAALREEAWHLRARTIHAFCRQLLAEHPLEAGLVPGFAVDAEGEAAAEAVREVLEEELPRAWSGPLAGALALLAEARVGPPEIEEALLRLHAAGARAPDLAPDPLSPAAAEAFLAEARAAFDAALAVVGGLAPALRKSGTAVVLVEGLERVAALASAIDPTDAGLEELGLACAELASKARKRLREWSRGELNKTEEAVLGERRAALVPACEAALSATDALVALRPRLLRAAHAVLATFARRVEDELAERGVVSYSTLLVAAARLLETRPDVLARERARIRQLCVDEFQDTDGVQCALVRRLALGGRGAREAPGLFVVGDPKQSIYAWRSADLAAYDAFAAELVAAGGERHRLTLNFRSVQEVLDEVERIVAPSMLAELGLQPPFQPLVAARGAAGTPAVEHWAIAEAAGGTAAAARESEGLAIARRIDALRAEGVPLEEIAILVRSTSELEPLLEPLRRFAIRFAVSRDRSYWRRREVLDATALARCVLDPADQLALVAWLRSPAVGVPDAAWIPLWRERLPELALTLADDTGPELEALLAAVGRAAAATPRDVPGLDALDGWEESLRRALVDLARLRAAFAAEDAARFVEALRARGALEVASAGRFLGRFRVENLEAFFGELERRLLHGRGEPAALARSLRRALERSSGDGPARPPREERGALRVATIHASKGLAFRHVFLAQTDRKLGGGPRAEPLLARASEGGAPPALAAFGAVSPAARAALEHARRVEEAERVRLLYVATTRARDRLVVSARERTAPAPSFAALVALREPPAPALEDAPLETDGVRFERVRAEEPEELSRTREAFDEAELERARAAHARLEADTEAARARMRRPLGRAATDLGREEEPEVLPTSAEERDERLARAAARAAGRAVHRALELVGVGGTGGTGSAGSDPRALALEALRAEGCDDPGARARVEQALASPLVARLRALAPRVRARELALLAPAAPDDPALEWIAGAIDLVYEDPASGDLVVADFKTEPVASGVELTARARLHAPQLALYARLLADALRLEREPRRELWFLAPGEVVVV